MKQRIASRVTGPVVYGRAAELETTWVCDCGQVNRAGSPCSNARCGS